MNSNLQVTHGWLGSLRTSTTIHQQHQCWTSLTRLLKSTHNAWHPSNMPRSNNRRVMQALVKASANFCPPNKCGCSQPDNVCQHLTTKPWVAHTGTECYVTTQRIPRAIISKNINWKKRTYTQIIPLTTKLVCGPVCHKKHEPCCMHSYLSLAWQWYFLTLWEQRDSYHVHCLMHVWVHQHPPPTT